MDRDHVGLPHQRGQVDQRAPGRVARKYGSKAITRLPNACQVAGHQPSHRPEADQADRLLVQFGNRVAVGETSPPLAGFQAGVGPGQVADLGQDQPHRALGHGPGVAARRVQHAMPRWVANATSTFSVPPRSTPITSSRSAAR